MADTWQPHAAGSSLLPPASRPAPVMLENYLHMPASRCSFRSKCHSCDNYTKLQSSNHSRPRHQQLHSEEPGRTFKLEADREADLSHKKLSAEVPGQAVECPSVTIAVGSLGKSDFPEVMSQRQSQSRAARFLEICAREPEPETGVT